MRTKTIRCFKTPLHTHISKNYYDNYTHNCIRSERYLIKIEIEK